MKTQKKQTLRPPHKSTAAHKLPSITGRHKFIIYVPGHITVCTCHHVEFALTIVRRFIFFLSCMLLSLMHRWNRGVSVCGVILYWGTTIWKGLPAANSDLAQLNPAKSFTLVTLDVQFVRRGEKAFSVGFLSYLHKWRNYRPKKHTHKTVVVH